MSDGTRPCFTFVYVRRPSAVTTLWISVLKYRAAIGAGAVASTTVRLGKACVIVNPARRSEEATRPNSVGVGEK